MKVDVGVVVSVQSIRLCREWGADLFLPPRQDLDCHRFNETTSFSVMMEGTVRLPVTRPKNFHRFRVRDDEQVRKKA